MLKIVNVMLPPRHQKPLGLSNVYVKIAVILYK